MHSHFPPPADDRNFEALCRDLFAARWGLPAATLHGRSGQAQDGVDVYAQRADGWWAVQCKCKTTTAGAPEKLTTTEVKKELAAADGFLPRLTHFIIATTALRDKRLQGKERQLKDDRRVAGKFDFEIAFWNDLEEWLHEHEAVARKYYPRFFAERRDGCLLAANWTDVRFAPVENACVEGTALAALPAPSPGSSVLSLLVWHSRIPKRLIGRDAEMAALHAWAAAPQDVSVQMLWGNGGVGKTRLAVEFGEVLAAQGWGMVLLRSASAPVAWAKGDAGQLLIVDYPEQEPEALQRLLAWFKGGTCGPGKWRVLLLSRNAQLQNTLEAAVPGWVMPAWEVLPLANVEQAWQVFAEGSVAMMQCPGVPQGALAWGRDRLVAWLGKDKEDKDNKDKDIHQHRADPLMLLALGLNLLYDPNASRLSRADILQTLVRHEFERLEKALGDAFSRAEKRGAMLLKALAAIRGGLKQADLQELQAIGLGDDEIKLPGKLTLIESALWDGEEIAEIQPDLLAAQAMHQIVEQYHLSAQAINAWCWPLLLGQGGEKPVLRQRFARLARLSWDKPDRQDGKYPLVDALQVEQAQAVAVTALFDAICEIPLRGLLLRATQALAADSSDLVKQAARLNNLSVRLSDQGERMAALDAIRCAVEIRETLARENFAAFAPALASSLNNLSNRLSDQGERTAALAASRRAVDIFDTLARENFAAFAPVLARSLNNFSNRLSEQGERTAALEAIRRAADIYDILARENFAAFAPVLAMSLNNLSNRLSEQGERTAALDAIRCAVDIRESLARENFAAFAPVLATSLNNLSLCLSEQGEYTAALEAIRRAIEIRETLAKQIPAVFEPVLANSLHILAWQLDNADSPQLMRRAISLITPYVIPNTEYADWVAKMQNYLAKLTP